MSRASVTQQQRSRSQTHTLLWLKFYSRFYPQNLSISFPSVPIKQFVPRRRQQIFTPDIILTSFYETLLDSYLPLFLPNPRGAGLHLDQGPRVFNFCALVLLFVCLFVYPFVHWSVHLSPLCAKDSYTAIIPRTPLFLEILNLL